MQAGDNEFAIVPVTEIENRIFNIRGAQVIDSHLGELYGLETKHINKTVKRNENRFPKEFMFQLTENERQLLNREIEKQVFDQNLRFHFGTSSLDDSLRSQIVTG